MKDFFGMAINANTKTKLLFAAGLFLLLVFLKDDIVRYILLGLSSYAFAELLIK